MAENLLVPAIVHFNLGSKSVNITDYQIDITLTNGCKYVQSLNSKAVTVYSRRRGGEIVQSGNMKVSVLKTPDKKFDDDIKKLEKALETTKENDPKKYVQSMLFTLATNDDKAFTNIQFDGYVSEISNAVDDETALQEITAEIEIYDPMSFTIKK